MIRVYPRWVASQEVQFFDLLTKLKLSVVLPNGRRHLDPGVLMVGRLARPTGGVSETPFGPTPAFEIISDGAGQHYSHANIYVDFDFGGRAAELATAEPALVEDLRRIFNLDELCLPICPATPKVKLAGDP